MGSAVTAISSARAPRVCPGANGRQRLAAATCSARSTWSRGPSRALAGGGASRQKTPVSAKSPSRTCGALGAAVIGRRPGLCPGGVSCAVGASCSWRCSGSTSTPQLLPDVLTPAGTLIGGLRAHWPGAPRDGGMLVGRRAVKIVAGLLPDPKVDGMGGGDVKLAAMFWRGARPRAGAVDHLLAAFAWYGRGRRDDGARQNRHADGAPF